MLPALSGPRERGGSAPEARPARLQGAWLLCLPALLWLSPCLHRRKPCAARLKKGRVVASP